MPKAIWNGAVLAESDDTIVVEGNHYFPREAIRFDYLEESDARTVCAWKGVASYFDVVVDDMRNAGAAWTYADPKPAAADIREYMAFWRGVRVEA